MPTTAVPSPDQDPSAARRTRPKPGERRLQILQALAEMLQQPQAERITTAALAARLGVSEAALYRHFASKAQMWAGLIDFIEHSLLGLVQQIQDREPAPRAQLGLMLAALLQFAERNPGMCRVMVGDALAGEDEGLQARINLLFDKLESAFKLRLREAGSPDAPAASSLLMAAVLGRIHRYARSGFQRRPTEHLHTLQALCTEL
jgi:TetR/AcrR family transcriptional regulator